MTQAARLFAYSTWVIMISLAIVVFTNSFLVFINDPGWIGLAALFAFGLIYLNFTYFVVKRFIRKVHGETILHFVLALLIFLPAAAWLLWISEEIGSSRYITAIVLAFTCGLGGYFGKRAGKREHHLYLEKIRS
ncbi:MAG: hypothetical protein WD355_02760 [Balneolaceae bacterium]